MCVLISNLASWRKGRSWECPPAIKFAQPPGRGNPSPPLAPPDTHRPLPSTTDGLEGSWRVPPGRAGP